MNGRYLKSAANPNGGYQFALISQVMKLYGLALSSTEERSYADSKKCLPAIERPYLSVLATTTGKSVTDAMAVEELLEGQSKALTQKAVEKALEGDMQALKLCLDRICPPRKSRPIRIELPKVVTAADVTAAHGAVITAMAQADITPDEANTIAGVLEAKRRAIETVEIEERLARLEAPGISK